MSDNSIQEIPSFTFWQQAIQHVRDNTWNAIRKQYNAPAEAVSDAFKARMQDATYWDGVTRPALGKKLHKDILDALEFSAAIKPLPWASAFQTWTLNDRHFDALVMAAQAQPELFNYDRFRGDVFESVGHALADGPDGQRLTSPEYNSKNPGVARYVTLDKDGNRMALSIEQVTKLLRDPNGPHVIVSANHAFLESFDEDVKGVFKAYKKMYEHTNGAEGKTLATVDKEDLSRDDTVMICALHTLENKYLNLAQLFNRVGEIEALHGDPMKDKFVHTAPVAIETTAMVLRTLVAEDEIGLIQPKRDEARTPHFVAEGATVHVTPEGIENLKRRIGEGFSKGGNDMRDAMRLLVHTLDSPQVKLPKGVSVADVISHISLTVTALNEMKMADYYRQNGVRVMHISNGNDTIAPVPHRPHDHADPVLNYIGIADYDGHAPSIAAKGIIADERTSAHFKTTFASTNDHAALSGIHLVDDENGPDAHLLRLEVSPGTTDAIMQQAFTTLQEKLAARQLGHVTLSQTKSFGTDRFVLTAGDGAPLITPEHIEAVREALAESDIVSDVGVAEKLRAIKGGILISQKSGKPLTNAYAQESADGLVRVDNQLRAGTVAEEVAASPPEPKLMTSSTEGPRPTIVNVAGSHSRIERNTLLPPEPREGPSEAHQHHDLIKAGGTGASVA